VILKAASMADLQKLLPRVTPGHVAHNSGHRFNYRPGINQYWLEPGWVADEFPGFDPATADVCVHDILEHFPGDPASVAGEYMAQGAAVYLRVEPGYFLNLDDLGAWVDSAFGTLFASVLAAYHATEEPPSNAPGCMGGEARRHMEDMLNWAATVTAPAQLAVWELAQRSPGTREEAQAALTASMNAALPWMIEGYQRAAARYDGCGKGARIAKVFACAVKQVSAIPWDMDTMFKLSINYGERPSEINCTVVHP